MMSLKSRFPWLSVLGRSAQRVVVPMVWLLFWVGVSALCDQSAVIEGVGQVWQSFNTFMTRDGTQWWPVVFLLWAGLLWVVWAEGVAQESTQPWKSVWGTIAGLGWCVSAACWVSVLLFWDGAINEDQALSPVAITWCGGSVGIGGIVLFVIAVKGLSKLIGMRIKPSNRPSLPSSALKR